MKAVILLSSLMLISGTAVAQDHQVRSGVADATFLSGFIDGAAKVAMAGTQRSIYKRSTNRMKPYSRQHKFDDDAYLRRISYND